MLKFEALLKKSCNVETGVGPLRMENLGIFSFELFRLIECQGDVLKWGYIYFQRVKFFQQIRK